MRLILSLSLVLCLPAQRPDDALRVSVTLVQVDAVVTDNQGRQVTDLTREEFQVFVDGKQRALTHFSYERTSAGARPEAGVGSPPLPFGTPRPQPSAVSRTIALLVDDLRMSFVSVHNTQEALRKFVDRQMEPGDLVAVIPTSGGAGALQTFTSDKKLLHAAINRLRYMLGGAGDAGSVRAIGAISEDPASLAYFRQRRFNVGTMGALRFVVQGMREMPGRKSLVLFADGVMLSRNAIDDPNLTVNEVRQAADRANRAAVVVYGIDPRGLPYPELQAQDDVAGLEQEGVREALEDRQDQFRNSHQGLQFLALETGGFAEVNNNDINLGLNKVLQDQSGYYLLGFQPEEFEAAAMLAEGKYHRIVVRVSRAGTRVRYRKGFLGDGRSAEPAEMNPAERLLAALRSPFAGTEISLRFTPTFTLGGKGQPMLRALVHIRGSDVTFGPPGSEGLRLAKLRIVAVTEGEAAIRGGTTERTFTVRATDQTLERLRQGGFVYSLEHEVKKPGAYQMRVAVLDDESGRVGSASRFVEVPDVTKAVTAISGVTMGEGDWRPSARSGSEAQEPEQDLSPAIRVFRRGHAFSYGVVVYNARFNEKTKQPELEMQARLIRENQVVWEGKRFAVAWQSGIDPRRIPAGGVLTLGEATPTGEYVLEMIATDTEGKRPPMSQWIDFELR